MNIVDSKTIISSKHLSVILLMLHRHAISGYRSQVRLPQKLSPLLWRPKVAVLLLEPQHKTKWVTTEKSPSANPKLTNELFDQSSYYWLNRLILRCYRSSRNYSGMSSFLLL